MKKCKRSWNEDVIERKRKAYILGSLEKNDVKHK